MHYRLAVPEDAPALLQIYSEYIHSTITFEYTLPTTEEFAERIRTIAGFYPYIVAEEDGRCMGYAYAHRHMERAAYQWNAELSVYLAKSAVGCGLGGGLYSRLMTLLKAQGILSVFGCVTSPNPPSDRLHKRMGFKLCPPPTGAARKRWNTGGRRGPRCATPNLRKRACPAGSTTAPI